MNQKQSVVIKCENLSKTYLQGSTEVKVLTDVSLEVKAGERVAVIGASGSGKSTLLSLLGALDIASSGSVALKGKDLSRLNDQQLSELRNQELGFVYQFHHLLPEFTALENVAMPLLIAGEKMAKAAIAAEQLLTQIGLSDRLNHRPEALSGGERQRVAIARALITQPSCVLLDEPTGNLDYESSATVQTLIAELAQHSHTAFVIVTHDRSIASMMDHQYLLKEGQLIKQSDETGTFSS